MLRRELLCAGAFAAAGVIGGCRRRRVTREERVRKVVALVERAVMDGDVSAVRAALAEGFRGGEDLDRPAAMAMLQLRLRARQVYLLSRVLNVDAPEEAPARAEVLVAMAGVPIPRAEDIGQMAADIHRFQLELEDDDDGPEGLRITRATWSPARLDDLLVR